jgi:hypothetical protein
MEFGLQGMLDIGSVDDRAFDDIHRIFVRQKKTREFPKQRKGEIPSKARSTKFRPHINFRQPSQVTSPSHGPPYCYRTPLIKCRSHRGFGQP